MEIGVDNMEAILLEDDKKPSARLNYSPSEDLCLCKAYVSTSCDPIHQTCQKQSTFWVAVRTKFLHLYDEIVGVKTPDFDPATTSSDSLMFRFNKTIAPEVRIFNKFYKRKKEKRPSAICAIVDVLEAAHYKHTVHCFN